MNEFTTIPRAEEYIQFLSIRLPEKTLLHVKSVARFMLTFYQQAAISEEQALTAGLLHDACKALKKDELAQVALKYNISDNLNSPNLLHGPVCAEVCKNELGIIDEDVLDAIRFHTTGTGNWNKVGCALYFADFSEPQRTLPESNVARKILETEGYIQALRYVVDVRQQYSKEKFEPNENSLSFFQWVADTTLYG